MFASLLAASRASSLGRVGCTWTLADMYAGRPMPSGSRPSLGTAETEFERPLTVLEDATTAEAESGSPRGWGAGDGADEGGPEWGTDACKGEIGVRGVGWIA